MTVIETAVAVAIVGLGATLIIDLWALLLKRVFKVSSLSFCLVGRWFAHMSAGRFVHPNIARAAPRKGECALGWSAHYLIGVVFAALLVAWSGPQWLVAPTLAPALGFGLLTVLLPFLVMQPALGLGLAAARSAGPNMARLKSLSTHGVFGLGLYASAVPLRFWLAA